MCKVQKSSATGESINLLPIPITKLKNHTNITKLQANYSYFTPMTGQDEVK